MLTKIESRVVRQPESRIRRAWYQSVSADVVLCHDAENGALLSFEIDGEGRGCRRWTVAWTRGVGIRTGSIDTGETEPLRYKAAPIVLWDFKSRADRVEAACRLIESSCIEEGLRESVLRRLRE